MKTYLSATLMLLCVCLHAQICPSFIKVSGRSTPSTPIFGLPNGHNSCLAPWPDTIVINDEIIYDFLSCNGGNLQYTIRSGQTPPDSFEMTVNFGDEFECFYDKNGNLKTLSSKRTPVSKALVYPNPTHGKLTIDLKSLEHVSHVAIYTLSGRLVFKANNVKTLHIGHFRSGVYALKIKTNSGILNHRIVKL